MTDIRRLGTSDLEAIARLCARAVVGPPSQGELADALFAPEQPAVVLGDPATGVAAVVACDDGAHLRLLAVDPDARGRGTGHALLEAAEQWAADAGHRSLTTGADPPYFLWPGVPSTETALLCLLERHHYGRVDTNFNMDVDLAQIPGDPGGHARAGAGDRDDIDAFATTHWSNWRLEVLRALDKGNLQIARDPLTGSITAFCAYEVNRPGLLGPVAVRPDLIGKGAGKAVLLGALHELRARGADRVSVVWVGPIVPYAAVGGRVADVFFVYRKGLA
jgi:GNAT superfamily N-acetyltransferase